MPHKIKVIGVVMSSDECIPDVEIIDGKNDKDGKDEVIATVYGERNAKLFAEAEEAFSILKKFVACVEHENSKCNKCDERDECYECRECYKEAKELINRVENSPELKCDGLTMTDLLEKVVKGK